MVSFLLYHCLLYRPTTVEQLQHAKVVVYVWIAKAQTITQFALQCGSFLIACLGLLAVNCRLLTSSCFMRILHSWLVILKDCSILQHQWHKYIIIYRPRPNIIHRGESKKGVAPIHRHNFDKCWPIFKILSLLDSARNSQQNCCYISYRILSLSLHYLAKYKKIKNGKNLTYLTQ